MNNNFETKNKVANNYHNSSSTKALIASLIMLIILLIIDNYFRMKVKDTIIEQLSKTIIRHELDNSLRTINVQANELKNRSSAITGKRVALMLFKETLENTLSFRQKSTERLLEDKKLKEYYKMRSETMSTFISPIYFERIEQITKSKILRLCYRSSRDKLDPQAFHSKCDGLVPTVTIIQSKNDAVFGGFTNVSWDGNEMKEDPTAFLFSLRFGIVHKALKGKPAISAFPSSLPIFGVDDIFISESRCYIRDHLLSYNDQRKKDLEYSYQDSESKEYFVLKELEVFHLEELDLDKA